MAETEGTRRLVLSRLRARIDRLERLIAGDAGARGAADGAQAEPVAPRPGSGEQAPQRAAVGARDRGLGGMAPAPHAP